MVERESDLPLLAVVIIARNEELRIGSCVASVLAATSGLPSCEVVLVDSCSTDRTVEVACRFPIRVVELNDTTQCCPALGRLVGERLTRSKYVLFVDGDTEIDSPWVTQAIRVLEESARVAGVGGKLREVYYVGGEIVGENPDCFNTSSSPEPVDQLGGNAIYRRAALDTVGSFNPYIASYEEAELAERLRKAGFDVLRIPVLLGTHRTGRPATLGELWRRYRSNLIIGYGQVLRVSVRDGLFWCHARRMNRQLLFNALLLLGTLSASLSLVLMDFTYLGAWGALCLILVLAFCARSRSITKPFRQVLIWSFWAGPLVVGFLRRPKNPRSFSLESVLYERGHGAGSTAARLGNTE